MEVYLISSDGYRDSILLDKYATNKEEIDKIVAEHLDDLGEKFLSSEIDYQNLTIKAKYIDICDDEEYKTLHLHKITNSWNTNSVVQQGEA